MASLHSHQCNSIANQLLTELLAAGWQTASHIKSAASACPVTECEQSNVSSQDRIDHLDPKSQLLQYFGIRQNILASVEQSLDNLLTPLIGRRLPTPLPAITHQQSMRRYGCSTPDLRYGMEILDCSSIVRDTRFRVFSQVLGQGGLVRGIRVVGGAAKLSRKGIDELTHLLMQHADVAGMSWFRVQPDGRLWSTFSKNLEPEILQSLQQAFGAESGDLLLLLADTWTKTCIGLDFLRTRIARELDLCPHQEFCLTWLIDDTRKPQHTQATWPESETAEPDRSTSATLLTHSNRFLLVANGREIGRGKTIHAAENASADSQLDDMTEQFFVTLDVYHLAQTLTALSRQRDNSSMPATQLAKDLSLYNHF